MVKLLILTIFSSLLLSCTKNIYQQKKESIKFKNNGRHIYIKLKANEYDEGNFYFDTASGWFIIDSTFYKNKRMSFNHFSESENIGTGNSPAKMIQILDTIKFSVSNNTFSSKYTMIHNLKKSFGRNIDGIVGFVNFGNIPFEINYIKQKIILNPEIKDNYQAIPVKYDGNYMYLPMELVLNNGTVKKGDFIIDTGSFKTILTSEFAKNEDIINSKKVTYINNGGVSGLHMGYSMFASEIKIDKFKLVNHQIDVSNDSIGALSKNKNYIGIVGNDLLDHFDIIYHPTQQKIWVRPNKNINKPSDDLYKAFVLIETNDNDKQWLVGSIYEESDAYKRGVKHRDEIVAINNVSVKKLNLEKFDRQLTPNEKLKLKVKRGDQYFEIDTYLNVFLRKNE
ncbi:aspartyl protease family protein [Chryseobacterium sp. 09-1422]|uniref:Aspartyl protease family protein n=1 Tax=Chryseobacterium kimseyorum TaxID=2984028 RepID=A0ABT3I1Z4_9FLAO|nr:aspartyl protease family protein [Chryseobacterium kimseyorum]MCW3170071.1 aspartyl protease family protein [Chryseobacterium kimseyorum]